MSLTSKLTTIAAANSGGGNFFALELSSTIDSPSVIISAVGLDPDGDIIIGGRVKSSLPLISKVSSKGDLIWDASSNLDGNPAGEVSYLDVDSSGNVYTVGRGTATSKGLFQKYDNDGVLQWGNEMAEGDIFAPSSCVLSTDETKLFYAGTHKDANQAYGALTGWVNTSTGLNGADSGYRKTYLNNLVSMINVGSYIMAFGTGYTGTTGGWPRAWRCTQTFGSASDYLTSAYQQATSYREACALNLTSNTAIGLWTYRSSSKFRVVLQKISGGTLATSKQSSLSAGALSLSTYDVAVDSQDNVYLAGGNRVIKVNAALDTILWQVQVERSGVAVGFNDLAVSADDGFVYLTGAASGNALLFKMPTDGSEATFGDYGVTETVDVTLSENFPAISGQADDSLAYGLGPTQDTATFTDVDPLLTESLTKG